MAPPPPIENALNLGFHFDPKARDVVAYILPSLIAGSPVHVCIRAYIHAADVYACEPGVLAARFRATPVAGDRFFFTTCNRQPQEAGKNVRAHRAAGPGSWYSHSATTDVTDGDGVKIGELSKLRYKKGGLSTDWLMDEVSSCHPGTVVGGDRQYVFCKMYVSPRAAADSAARQESDAFVLAPPPPRPAPPPPPPVEPAVPAPNKRSAQAPPIVEPPRKRIRGAAANTTADPYKTVGRRRADPT